MVAEPGNGMGLRLMAGAYILIALLAMIPTVLEQRTNGLQGVLKRLPGLVACLLWPLPLAAVTILALHRGRPRRAGS